MPSIVNRMRPQSDILIQRYPIVSDQIQKDELRLILSELEKQLTARRAGSVVELGCYAGTTSLFITRLLQAYGHDGTYHVYDSFQGLPVKAVQDISPVGEQFREGELGASKSEFIRQFKSAALPLPIIHKAWFADLMLDDMPKDIGFAFLDGDYYESIKDSFRVVTPRLAPHATLVVDDYTNEALPGARRAVDEWLGGHSHWQLRVQASLAIIHT